MPSLPSSRIVGLDLTRALAIIGMIVLHLAFVPWIPHTILAGIPAALFAVIAGFSMMLISRGTALNSFLKLLCRGLLLILLGIALLPFAGDIQ